MTAGSTLLLQVGLAVTGHAGRVRDLLPEAKTGISTKNIHLLSHHLLPDFPS